MEKDDKFRFQRAKKHEHRSRHSGVLTESLFLHNGVKDAYPLDLKLDFLNLNYILKLDFLNLNYIFKV